VLVILTLMSEYVERAYRRTVASDLVTFEVKVMQTDLLIAAERDLSAQAEEIVRACRRDLEDYIARDAGFKETLRPYRVREDAPEIVRAMAAAAALAGVGPMAAVAGAIAEAVGRGLAADSPQVIVENGGDIWLQGNRGRTVGVFAGASPFTGKLAVRLDAGIMPCSICTSSGTVGPSLSFGKADAAIAVAGSGALADAAATAIANAATSRDDLNAALELAQGIPGVLGAVVIIGDSLGAWGQVQLVKAA
jgi:ApbE superfamily uncharacterized protein (UPF0280 family)